MQFGIEIFLFACNAILPLLLLILLGFFLKTIGLINAAFLEAGNDLAFRVCLPCLLFFNVYSIESLSDMRGDIILFSVAAVLCLFGIGCAVSVFFKDRTQKGIIVQNAFRSDFAVIGIPLAESLCGASGLATASALSACVIPLYNVLAVISLSLFTKQTKPRETVRRILRGICTNPLIIGIAAGLVTLIIRSLLKTANHGVLPFSISEDLPFLYTAISNLAKMTSPFMLILLGAEFSYQALGDYKAKIMLCVFMRLILAPALGLGAAILLARNGLLHFDASVCAGFIAMFAAPVAVGSVNMAHAMQNDSQLATQDVVWTTLLSIPTLLVIIILMRAVGYL